MIEVVFSESAHGSLKAAQHFGAGSYKNGAFSVIVTRSDGKKPSRKQISLAQKNYEESQRIAWEKAVPMQGNAADIFSFSLMLSVGNISSEPFLQKRQTALAFVNKVHPYAEPLDFAQRIESDLQKIHYRVQQGEPLRIWYSDNPDEACGLYWFAAGLRPFKAFIKELYLVKLPQFKENENGTLSQSTAWGEIMPGEWSRYLPYQKTVSSAFIDYCSMVWQSLQQENAPLRVVLNGRVQGVDDALYDRFILKEIEAEENEFFEARVIGRVLGKYQLGISDSFIACRIEKMIESGRLKTITSPSKDEPIYRKKLRKQ